MPNSIKLFFVLDEFITEINFFCILIFLPENKLSAIKTRVNFFDGGNIGN